MDSSCLTGKCSRREGSFSDSINSKTVCRSSLQTVFKDHLIDVKRLVQMRL